MASEKQKRDKEFVVLHFACPVTYKIAGFVEKNRNKPAKEIQDCVQTLMGSMQGA